MTAAILQIEGLSLSYPGRPLFTGYSTQIGPGMTWLRGPNGCGKSTLLALLAGALRPITGHIAVNNISQASQPLDYRREVFWCGPGPVVFDHLRPPEYFGFIAGLYPRFNTLALAGHVQALGLAPIWASACRRWPPAPSASPLRWRRRPGGARSVARPVGLRRAVQQDPTPPRRLASTQNQR